MYQQVPEGGRRGGGGVMERVKERQGRLERGGGEAERCEGMGF